MTPQQLLAEIEDISRTMPSLGALVHATPENLDWLGRLEAFVDAWNIAKSIQLSMAITDLHSGHAGQTLRGVTQIQILVRQAHHSLRLKTIGPLNAAVGQGLTFDYFDGVRKIIEPARSDLFFIDRYMDAEFVSRYLPHVATGVSMRLLARDKISSLRPAVEAYVQQSKAKVEIRSSNQIHDRYVIVDRSACYQSGASFKDGAKAAPTTLTQITDAFEGVLQTYEAIWSRSKTEC